MTPGSAASRSNVLNPCRCFSLFDLLPTSRQLRQHMFLLTCAGAASVQRARFYWPSIQTSHYLLSASTGKVWSQFRKALAGKTASGQEENGVESGTCKVIPGM